MSESTNAAVRIGRRTRSAPDSLDSPDWCSYAVLADGPDGGAYSEEAFRYLLAIERKRSERSSRPFFLLLVDLKKVSGQDGEIDAAVAANIFGGLGQALRETDFFGWYREGRIVGAVLAQLTDSVDAQVPRAVCERVKEQVRCQLPADVAGALQMRVFQLPRKSRS